MGVPTGDGMRVALITCTGDRPAAFALCEKWMASQTKKPVAWVVVDDGPTATATTMGQRVLRRKVTPQDPEHTLIPNLRLGLPIVARLADLVLFIEDDDYYAPDFIERMVEQYMGDGSTVDLVGESYALYYHVGYRMWYEHRNHDRASLCCTGIRAGYVPHLLSLCQDPDPFVDMRLWATTQNKRVFFQLPRTCVGIKGMPGRDGIGSGHRNLVERGYNCDPTMAKLVSEIGPSAAKHYEMYFNL